MNDHILYIVINTTDFSLMGEVRNSFKQHNTISSTLNYVFDYKVYAVDFRFTEWGN